MSSELIFLLHPDEATRERLSTVLHQANYKVLTAEDEAGALRHLAEMRFVLPDALVLPLVERSPLLEKLRQNPLTADLAIVVLAERADEDRRLALRQGLSDLLPAPFDSEELLLTLRLALQRSADRRRDSRSLRGSLALLPVVDLLQTLEAGRRTGVVDLRDGGKRATLWLRQGQPVDAELDDGRRGDEAVYEMVRFGDGTFEVVFGEVTVPQRISTSLTGLLLEALRRIDEDTHETSVPFAALEDAPPRPTREMLAAHRALTLLNVASAYAMGHVQIPLLTAALEETRRALLTGIPELALFELGNEGQIALPQDPLTIPPDRLVLAAASWSGRLFERFERAFPGKFGKERLRALTGAVRDDMDDLGFDGAMQLEQKALEVSR